MTTVKISIETEDLALVDRISAALKGGMPAGRWSADKQDVAAQRHADSGPDYPDGPEFKGWADRAEAAQKELDDVRDDMAGNGYSRLAPGATVSAGTVEGGAAARAFGNAGTATAPESARPADTTGPTASIADTPETAPGATAGAASPHHDTPRPAAGEELDADGMPWDERINTSNKGKTQRGVWKRKPKIADELYNDVREELKATTAGVKPLEEPAGATPPPPPAEPEAKEPDASTPPPPPPGQPVVDIKFPQLVRRCTSEKVPTDTLNQVLNRHGVVRLPDLMKRADLVPVVYAELFPEG